MSDLTEIIGKEEDPAYMYAMQKQRQMITLYQLLQEALRAENFNEQKGRLKEAIRELQLAMAGGMTTFHVIMKERDKALLKGDQTR